MSSLMEIYMNNNRIESIKEANHLRDIEKLIILDLSGNPMCKDKDYRLYSIYHLKKLKVLCPFTEAQGGGLGSLLQPHLPSPPLLS